MSNVTVPNFYTNYPLEAEHSVRPFAWKLTRALKASGWRYIAGSNGYEKDTSADPAKDPWNGFGATINSGSGASMTYSTYLFTITGLSGMTADSVGRKIRISGATLINNNGEFPIVQYVSATSVRFWNRFGSSDTNSGNITWEELESSATVPNQTGSSASITTKTGNRVMTLTGLTGMTPLSEQHYLTISGASSAANNGTFKILKWLSATSVTIINSSGVASDVNNGAISWIESDPLLERYAPIQNSSSTGGAWTLLQGPSTLKIPITSAASGTFIKGENVTQAGTGAEGEILGYQFETTTGFLVVHPRVDGNGAGPLGWDTSAIVGDQSGASITPSATVEEYVREMVMWIPSTTVYYMTIYFQCVNTASENTQRFSYRATSAAGCTLAIAPAGGGTSNTFPTIGSHVPCGTGNTSTSTYSFFTSNSMLSSEMGSVQIMVASCLYDEDKSADGSFVLAIPFLYSSTTDNNGDHTGFAYSICDNAEDGDVDPYVWYQPNPATLYSTTIPITTAVSSYFSTPTSYYNAAYTIKSGAASTWAGNMFRGFRRRSMANESFLNFTGASICTATNFVGGCKSVLYGAVPAAPIITTKPEATIGQPIWVVSDSTSLKMRKGTPRWLRLVSSGAALSLYNNSWIQLSNNLPAMIAGPWDGFFTPKSSK